MMTCTESCSQWAQWKVTTPERDAAGDIVRLRTVAILCGQHKKSMEKMAESSEPKIDLRFNFVGAVPNGSYHPQS
jgi:hypothetical protein